MSRSGYSSPHSQVIRIPRSQVQPGDVILGPAPPERSLVPRQRPRPLHRRRASSLDGDDYHDAESQRQRQVGRRREPRDQYDSEGSIPPRFRRSVQHRRRDGAHRGDRGDGSSSSSSASSSDLGCSDDDKKMKKKAKLKKWGTVGLAGVATIHAVAGVHSTLEKGKKRQEELQDGNISEEEARQMRKRGMWKNAANVGVAAVWIKGAVDEIKECREAGREQREVRERVEDRRQRRGERAMAILRGEYQGGHRLTKEERRKYARAVEEEESMREW